MTVLVTGGAGYIGSHTVRHLIEHGEKVLVVDRLSTGHQWAVPAEAELLVGDISDQPMIEAAIRRHDVEAIVHFAGSVVVPDSVTDPLGYYLNNTVASRSLIESAVRCGVRHFIFSSTAAVYGTPERSPVDENAPLRPQSPYGMSKLMTEIMLKDAAAAHDLTYTVLRYFNVAGADPQMRTGQSTKGATHLIKVAAEAATGQRDFIEVFGTDYPTPDGTCIRDFIHVSDLADAHVAALDRLRRGGANLTANCGYGRGFSVLEVLEAVKRLAKSPFEVRMGPRRTGDLTAIVADSTCARTELRWNPRFGDLDTIVGHSIEWEQRLRLRNDRD